MKKIKCVDQPVDYIAVQLANESVFIGVSIDGLDEDETCIVLNKKTIDELIDALIEARGGINE